MPDPRDCPRCGTPSARPIVSGLVLPQLLDDPDVALGGCLVGPDAPAWRCRDAECRHEFGLVELDG